MHRFTLLSSLFLALRLVHCAEPSLIFYNGKIVTVDERFSVQHALAIQDGRVLQTGDDQTILKSRGAGTKVVDLAGKMVLPGLIDSHVHPVGASMTEFDHPIPDMETIADVLKYVKECAQNLKEDEWVSVSQVFITRLKEMRYPARTELDEASPKNPVFYRTGPDASLNSLALKAAGIEKDFKVTDGGSGFFEKDADGEPNGVIRNLSRFVKVNAPGKKATDAEKTARLVALLKDYNSVGLTTIGDRDASESDIERYVKVRDADQLTMRVAFSHDVTNIGPINDIVHMIHQIAEHPLFRDKQKDGMLRIIGIKTYMDGGMLTGSAYMRAPWGVSKLYGITDPEYRGVRFIPHERLVPMVRAAVESKLQFTAHSVGDGAVHALLDAYEEVSKDLPIRETRPCVTHSNFMSEEAIAKAAKLGVSLDIQPIWLYMDTRALMNHFGYERLRWFQPLKSIFAAGVIAGGGSDHMMKVGSFRAINPYNPFLGMQTAITRTAKWYDGVLHPEEALTREQAIRFYTRNNAYILFCDDQVGSLEAGKRADLIVIDQDLLTCPADEISKTQVLETYLEGKQIYLKP
ncbi:MAG TPA: amidohydrolase [Planctomycetota bacterium]|nr:amidohydrolase [Planctomycetota bacterium]